MTRNPSPEITPEKQYASRREFIKALGVVGVSAAVLAACQDKPFLSGDDIPATTGVAGETGLSPQAGRTTDELGDALTSYDDVISYNNFYEFTTDKEGVERLAENFQTSPWEVQIGGLVENPGGFPLAALLEDVQPTSDAKYVRFESIYDPKELPGQKNKYFPWPYVEGLRLDEAHHDLTILATGLYGKDLLPQNGAPVRLVVPWKYGFKSIKSITKIDLVSEMPVSLWMESAPNEYGFYANVNHAVDHPRWSQATERRIGEISRRPSRLFNGYEQEVKNLYEGMDLTKNF